MKKRDCTKLAISDNNGADYLRGYRVCDLFLADAKAGFLMTRLINILWGEMHTLWDCSTEFRQRNMTDG